MGRTSGLALGWLAINPAHFSAAASKQEYIDHAIDAANLLCASYNATTGLFPGGDGTAGEGVRGVSDAECGCGVGEGEGQGWQDRGQLAGADEGGGCG